jgi:hypothetical protein
MGRAKRKGKLTRSRRKGGIQPAQVLQLWAFARGLRAIGAKRRKGGGGGRRRRTAGLALVAGALGGGVAFVRSRAGSSGHDAGDPSLVAQPTGGDERTARDVGGPTSPTSGAGETVTESGGATAGAAGESVAADEPAAGGQGPAAAGAPSGLDDEGEDATGGGTGTRSAQPPLEPHS